MKEQSLGLPVYLLGYPIALAIMIAFYASEVLHGGVRMIRHVLAIDPGTDRKADRT